MRIVVRAPNWLGDIAMSFPFFQALPEVFPRAEVSVIIKPEYQGLLDLLPYSVSRYSFSKGDYPGISGLIRFAQYHQNDLGGADCYFTLAPSFSSALMGKLLRSKERVGMRGQARSFLLTRTVRRNRVEHRSLEYLSLLPEKPGVAKVSLEKPEGEPASEPGIILNINSEAPSRRIPLEQWIRFLKSYPQSRFLLVGTIKDHPRIRALLEEAPRKHTYVDLAGRTDIRELARVLSRATGVISCDSGPAHLASLFGRKVVVFFGAGDPVNTKPYGDETKTLVLRQDLSCSPCLKNHCPIGTLECLTSLPMEDMAERAAKFLL